VCIAQGTELKEFYCEFFDDKHKAHFDNVFSIVRNWLITLGEHLLNKWFGMDYLLFDGEQTMRAVLSLDDYQARPLEPEGGLSAFASAGTGYFSPFSKLILSSHEVGGTHPAHQVRRQFSPPRTKAYALQSQPTPNVSPPGRSTLSNSPIGPGLQTSSTTNSHSHLVEQIDTTLCFATV